MLSQSQEHRYEYPPDRIVDDGRGEDDLAHGAADEAELAHERGDDLDRRHGKRRADEESEQEALVRLHQHRGGEQLDRQHAEEEGQADAAHGDVKAGPAEWRMTERSVSMPVSSRSRRTP